MNKKITRTALAVCGAMLLSGCFPSFLLPERPSGTAAGTTTSGSLTPPVTTTTTDGLSAGTEVTHDWTDERGTVLSFSDQKLDIQRLDRENDVPMSSDGVWTVFVYMCGSDLETESGAATKDLLEMEAATGDCDKLRFVVEAGGCYEWLNNMCEDMMSQRLLIEGGYTEVLDSGDARDMGAASTLADFVGWGVENYSSQYMVLDLWNHGGGSISGVCFDELHGDDSLSLEEIDTALASVFGEMTDRFELIGFDACLMATVEMANILVPYGRYMVGSQELESCYGWDYGCFAEAVNKSVDNGRDMGRYICDWYYESCFYSSAQDSATLSVIDLSELDAFLEAFNAYAKELYDYAIEGGMTDIIKAAKNAMNFGGNNKTEGYTNMIDLLSFLDLTYEYVSENSYDAELMLMDDVVYYTANGHYKSNAGGLSIYYPLSVQGSNELDTFRNICVSPYYLSLVDLCAYGSDNNGYIGGFSFDEWLSDGSGFWSSFFNWNDSSYDYWNNDEGDDLNFDYSSTAISFIDEPQLDEDGFYYFRLTEDSLYNLDTVYCNLMMSRWDGDREYMLDLGTDDYVDLDWFTGECYDNFNGYWFALPDGQPLCVYLTEVFYDDNTDEYYNIYSAPIYINGEDTYLRIKQTYDYDGMTTEILGAWDGISESGSASRDLYQLQVGDRISPCYPAYDAYTGEYVMDFYGNTYFYTGDAEIGTDMLYEGDYYYAFEIYDLYDNAVYTDFVMFGLEKDGSIYYYG